MSVKFIDRVWDDHSISDRIELLVLLSLADQANDGGTCYPGIENIAKRTRISVRSAQYAIRRLEQSGKLEILPATSHLNTNIYKLLINPVPVSSGDSGGAALAPGGVQPLHQGGANHGPVLAPKPSGTVSKPFKGSTPKKTVSDQIADSDLLAIYAAYPRKVGKVDALKAIRTALKVSGLTPVQMLDLVSKYATTYVGERQYMPYPATWFNRGSYGDDPSEWNRSGGSLAQNSGTPATSLPAWRRVQILKAEEDRAKEAVMTERTPANIAARQRITAALEKARQEEVAAAISCS